MHYSWDRQEERSSRRSSMTERASSVYDTIDVERQAGHDEQIN